jgi:hypothetical protein
MRVTRKPVLAERNKPDVAPLNANVQLFTAGDFVSYSWVSLSSPGLLLCADAEISPHWTFCSVILFRISAAVYGGRGLAGDRDTAFETVTDGSVALDLKSRGRSWEPKLVEELCC